ncbi:CAMK/CAMK1 protein kinase [Saprolegnia parasitica CBS 223.65]|uniref:CAMK/CAMK1 protein kinase n=1 Tax=Saprolegnia parasitica (strain CBS 223.65) TaxID=695850 RepID=A0A067CNA2_SAPPC|nr:CAMK/CAMK1 protein kinase [Saprolegnia parasitica CBS 223.65]KDO28031.1 CAMK/CAMK1 protein kinase [Saprolegnia parasitica CBS 223.65]|eukprot:XP_012201184.1 CAMK/CAMK1 protein kinase [Saprolegnia parasitica CBS 223.65]
MGQVVGWCLGDAEAEATMRKQKPSAQTAGAEPSEVRSMGSGEIYRSRPKAILSSGPMYAVGSFDSKYKLLSVIGNGSTSICHLCEDKATGAKYACKIIDKRAVQSKSDDLLEQFQPPNIIHMEDVYQTDNRISMVTELMEGGELFDYIVNKGTLSEIEASCLVRKITSALAYMHACGVVHRDLKPENLLLTSKSPNAEVKIIDFGLAKLLHDNQTRSFLGTRGYLAPEMLRRQSYSKSVDVWALGVIVYVLLCGCLPFNDDGSKINSDKAARAKFGLRFPRWSSGLSDSAKDLLHHLLEVDSEKRYTAEQACLHPWVTGQRTPNKYLESPNHLKSIRLRRKVANDEKTISGRRLSH